MVRSMNVQCLFAAGTILSTSNSDVMVTQNPHCLHLIAFIYFLFVVKYVHVMMFTAQHTMLPFNVVILNHFVLIHN